MFRAHLAAIGCKGLRTSDHVIGIWSPPMRVAAFLKCCSISEIECPRSSFNLVSCSTYPIKRSLGTSTDNMVVGLLVQERSPQVSSDPSFSHTWESLSLVPELDVALRLPRVGVVNNQLTWRSNGALVTKATTTNGTGTRYGSSLWWRLSHFCK